MALLSLSNIHKTFEKGTVNENHVLRGLDLDIEQGDFISVIGGNGAGKSTLMRILILTIKIWKVRLENGCARASHRMNRTPSAWMRGAAVHF